MRTGRNITSVFLLLLLTAPLLFLSFLQLKQAYIKHTVEERLEARLLKTIFIPKHQWHRLNSREILVADKWFDVKDLTETSDGVVVTGVFDEDETALVQQIDAASTQQAQGDTPVFAQAFQLLQHLFYQEATAPFFIAGSPAKLFQNPIVRLAFRAQPVLCPPPQRLA